VEINIDPQAVNQLVADAVLKSAVGETLKVAVDNALKGLMAYNSPIEAEVKRHVAQMVREILEKEHAEPIKERIRVAVAGAITDEMMDKIISKAVAQVNDRY
jgi:hypothetical protein